MVRHAVKGMMIPRPRPALVRPSAGTAAMLRGMVGVEGYRWTGRAGAPVAAVLCLLLPALPAGAGPGSPAVGRIERAGRPDICTGALIAPDLVLTAAHCMYRPGGGVVAPEDVTFRAGPDGPEAPPPRRGRRVTLHPDYAGRPAGWPRYEVDLALVEIEPGEGPAPLVPGFAPLPGAAVTLVSYRNGRGEAAVVAPGCPIRAREGAVLAIGCEVSGGASGGAAIMAAEAGQEIVATIVARATGTEGEPLAFALALDTVLPQLLAAAGD